MLILPFQSYLISVSLCTCVLFNLLIVVFIRLFDHHNILFFDTQLFCNKVSLYRQIVLTLFIVHLRAFFLLHTCNFKNLNVLFPKKKSHKYPFDETQMTLMITTDIILIFLILYSTSSLYLKCLILLCWNFVCFRHMYYVCTDLLMLHYNLFLMSFVFDIIYLI